MQPLIIAIDGPSGAGKGTVARGVATALGYRHVDTGAMYRGVALLALEAGVPLTDEARVTRVASDARFVLEPGRVLVGDRDVSTAIRTPEIDRAAAAVARLPGVRAALVRVQRALGAERGIVMEGRDIGTVVFPDADVKVYLDASPEERARRRAADPAHTGHGEPVASVAVDLEARDRSDRTRVVSPLAIAPDAIVVDTTGTPVEEVVSRVLAIVRNAAARIRPASG